MNDDTTNATGGGAQPFTEQIEGHECLFTSDETGGYVVTCPTLPGLVTEGDTLEEARRMAADAIKGYRASLTADEEGE